MFSTLGNINRTTQLSSRGPSDKVPTHPSDIISYSPPQTPQAPAKQNHQCSQTLPSLLPTPIPCCSWQTHQKVLLSLSCLLKSHPYSKAQLKPGPPQSPTQPCTLNAALTLRSGPRAPGISKGVTDSLPYSTGIWVTAFSTIFNVNNKAKTLQAPGVELTVWPGL